MKTFAYTYGQAACTRMSLSPREGTRPTRFPWKSACIVGPVPPPGGVFNGLLAWSIALFGAVLLSQVSSVVAAATNSNQAQRKLLYVAAPGIRNYLEYGGHGVLVFD